MSDIIFNLLLFFLLTASFASETGFDLSLPKTVQPTTVTASDVVVTLTRAGGLLIGPREVDWKDLDRELAAAVERTGERRVVIRGDEGIALGKVVEVMDAARRAGAEGLALAAEAKGETEGKPGRGGRGGRR